MQLLKACKHSKAQKMQTYKGENYDTKGRKHGNMQRGKRCKHATVQNMQTFKVAKDA